MRRCLVAWVVLVPALAAAQHQYMNFKNLSSQSAPFVYSVDNRLDPVGGVTVTEANTATVAAWNQWNMLTCAVPKASRAGYANGVVPDPESTTDTYNVAPAWLTNPNDPHYIDLFLPTGAAAITVPLSYGGVLQQCDIFFNGVSRSWSTSSTTPANAMDVESVMLHEAGHCLGLDHDNPFAMGGVSTDDVMYGAIYAGQTKRRLTAYDAEGLCQRYPTANANGSPCSADGGCGGAPRKCVTQPMGSGPAAKFCTTGCNTTINQPCDFPLSCQTSNDFAPTLNGACLLPGTSITQVGKPCSNASQCGSSIGLCQLPASSPSGGVFWSNGYCLQNCAPGQPDCPAGSFCTQLTGAAYPVCLQGCRVGLADCRADYSCALTSNGGVCVPSCRVDADCGAQYRCRTCDGLCVEQNTSTAMLGDICTTNQDCGLGQICNNVLRTSPVQICTTPCGTGCGGCPNGSTCHPIGSGEFYCLRDCQTGTCPTGLQCGQLPTGRGCIPPCSNDAECPVGFTCQFGECTGPPVEPDSGCMLLCGTTDSGVPINPRPPDGGTGGGGSGGCGCGAAPSQALLAMGLLLAARRRSWRSR